jgi:tetratricopeptide (TPR) repeat protein
MMFSIEQTNDALARDIEQLSGERRFNEALEQLDRAIETHRDSPDISQLRRAVAVHRARILSMAERYPEALNAWQERAALGLRYPADAYEVALGRGSCFIKMGNPKTAVEILEVTLDRADPAHSASIRLLLEELQEAYAAMDQRVPERWREVAGSVNLTLSPKTTSKKKPLLGLRSLVRKSSRALRLHSKM